MFLVSIPRNLLVTSYHLSLNICSVIIELIYIHFSFLLSLHCLLGELLRSRNVFVTALPITDNDLVFLIDSLLPYCLKGLH